MANPEEIGMLRMGPQSTRELKEDLVNRVGTRIAADTDRVVKVLRDGGIGVERISIEATPMRGEIRVIVTIPYGL